MQRMKSYRFFLGGSSGAAADVISSCSKRGSRTGKISLANERRAIRRGDCGNRCA